MKVAGSSKIVPNTAEQLRQSLKIRNETIIFGTVEGGGGVGEGARVEHSIFFRRYVSVISLAKAYPKYYGEVLDLHM